MPKEKFLPYQCPRCGRETSRKDIIRDHFYKRKSDCPGTLKVLDLTEDIKEFVLLHRRYTPSQTSRHQDIVQNIQNITNNNHVIINFVAGLDTCKKLEKVIAYRGQELVDFEQSVDEKYQEQSEHLKRDKYKHLVCYTKSHYLDMVSDISSIPHKTPKNFERLNLYYDNSLKALNIYSNGEWVEYRLEDGVSYVVETLALSFLYSYEIYLIKKLENVDIIGRNRGELDECLRNYFRFLSCVNVSPYVKKSLDEMSVYNEIEEEVAEKYIRVYENMNITVRELHETRRSIIDVFKRNTMKNIVELNNTIHDLIKGDDAFRNEILTMR
jgi:hypothetical protein